MYSTVHNETNRLDKQRYRNYWSYKHSRMASVPSNSEKTFNDKMIMLHDDILKQFSFYPNIKYPNINYYLSRFAICGNLYSISCHMHQITHTITIMIN